MARHPTYMGPKVQVQPSELARLEATGQYAAEEKHDGHWAEVTTDLTGKIIKIVGRSGSTFSGANVEGLIGFNTGLAASTLICELEAGTEAANKRNGHMRHRRLWVFDVVRLLDHDTRQLPYEKRRELLELAFKDDTLRVRLVRRVTSNFQAFFDDVASADGEGLVLKRLGRAYKTYGSDGKTDEWIRCKRFRYVDYVVMEIGKSEGGSPNFQVGLVVNGKLQRVATIKNIPNGLNYKALVGKVIECKGAEVHESGALRHGHYERTRDDKEPEECTLEAALRA